MEFFKKYKYLFYLLIGLLLFLVGSLFGELVIFIVGKMKYGYDVKTSQSIITYFSYYYDVTLYEGIPWNERAQEFFALNPSYFTSGKFLAAVMQLSSYLPLVIFIGIVLWKDLFEDLKKLKSELARNIIIIIVTFGVMMGVSLILSMVYTILGIEGSSANESTLELMMAGEGKWYLLIAVVIFAPICEEIIFRKLIIDTCEKHFNLNPIIAICISSFVFAFIHVTDCASFIFIFQYLGLAIPLCLAYHYSNNNIYVSIAVHMANNLLTGIAYLIEYGI